MFIKAISAQKIDSDYLQIDIGEEVSGNVRSYNQDFLFIEEMYDNPEFNEEPNEENHHLMFKSRNIRLSLEKNSIQPAYCGCGERAKYEYRCEYLCENCEYEEPEDHSYLCYSPFEF